MFKAKYIGRPDYYNNRRAQLMWSLVVVIPLVMFSLFWRESILLALLILALYGVMNYFIYLNQRRMSEILSESQVVMDTDGINIVSKGNKYNRVIDISDVDRVIVKDEYKQPNSSLSDVGKEIVGRQVKNYIEVEYDKKKERFDFELESDYMKRQLSRVLESWKEKGVQINIEVSD